MNNYLSIDDCEQARFADLYERYRLLSDDPAHCSPMFIINTPVNNVPRWEERLADPMVMLKGELDLLRPHLEIGDDHVPTVRVQFGTAQIAAAFGCKLAIPTNTLPVAETHALVNAEDVFTLEKPSLNAGWYGKHWEWTELWKSVLPEGVHIQLPDIQSAFNSAHLIRGNDILMDFYDAPEALERLFTLVVDFMIDVTAHVNSMTRDDPEWFFDWGAQWKGSARISNCSMHMISPDFYREHVLPHDRRFLEAVGGGRIHYCGTPGEVIEDFYGLPGLNGLDVSPIHHEYFALCEATPDHIALLTKFGQDAPEVTRLLAGDWPRKRNLIIQATAASVGEGRALLKALRKSWQDARRCSV